MRKALLLLVLLALQLIVSAQTVPIVSTVLADSAGHPYTGIVFLQPTLANGQPTAYQQGGGGTITSAQISVMANAGAFSVAVPDTTLTNPPNICFKLTAPGIGKGYNCLQPHATATGPNDWCQAGVCYLDKYAPNTAPQPLVPTVETLKVTGEAIVPTPVNPTDAATKTYVDAETVRAESAEASLGATGSASALSMDGVSLGSGTSLSMDGMVI